MNLHSENPYNGPALFVSREIMDMTNLTMSEKLILSIYRQCEDDLTELDFWISNSGMSDSLIRRSRAKLRKLGLIKDIKFTSPQEAKEFTIKHSHKGRVCEWCGRESFVLHTHHYPIPARLGGEDTVEICPNCHSTFHAVHGGR